MIGKYAQYALQQTQTDIHNKIYDSIKYCLHCLLSTCVKLTVVAVMVEFGFKHLQLFSVEECELFNSWIVKQYESVWDPPR